MVLFIPHLKSSTEVLIFDLRKRSNFRILWYPQYFCFYMIHHALVILRSFFWTRSTWKLLILYNHQIWLDWVYKCFQSKHLFTFLNHGFILLSIFFFELYDIILNFNQPCRDYYPFYQILMKNPFHFHLTAWNQESSVHSC